MFFFFLTKQTLFIAASRPSVHASDQSITLHSSPYFYALSPALTWAEGRVTPLDLLSVHHRATLTDKDRQPFTPTHTAHLKLPIGLTCMFFGLCEKRTHTDTGKTTHRKTPAHRTHGLLTLSVTVLTTAPPWTSETGLHHSNIILLVCSCSSPLAHIFLNPLAGATCRNYQSNLIGRTNG